MKVRDIMSGILRACKRGYRGTGRPDDEGPPRRLLPVCSQQKVIGIVTDRDIALRSVAGGQDVKQQKVGDVMSSDPVVETRRWTCAKPRGS